MQIYRKLTEKKHSIGTYLQARHVADEDGWVTSISDRFNATNTEEQVKLYCAYKYGVHPDNIEVELRLFELITIDPEVANEIYKYYQVRDKLEEMEKTIR